MAQASCKNGKKGKFKHQKPQRRSSDRRSCSKNRNGLPCEKRRIQKQSLSPSEVSHLSSSSMNFFPPVGYPVYSDALSSFPASSVGEELAICSSKPEPTSLSQLCCGAPSFPGLSSGLFTVSPYIPRCLNMPFFLALRMFISLHIHALPYLLPLLLQLPHQ